MSSGEILQLCVRARAGSAAARAKLLEAHIRLIAHVARNFYRPGAFLEWEDLMQQGCLGLLRAIEKFDPQRCSRGKRVQFATYAHYWIFHCISREIENHGRTVAVPMDQLKKLKPDSAQYAIVPLDGEWFEDDQGVARARWVDMRDTPEDGCRAWDARRTLERLLNQLSGRKRDILMSRYGLSPTPQTLTQAEVGKKLQLSGPRVGVLERAALRQLRETLR